MFRRVYLALVLILIIGCGGGSSSNITGPSGNSSGSGSSASMSVTQFDVTPTTILNNQQFTVHWAVSYSPLATGYTAEFHVNDSPSLISGCTGCTIVFSLFGDMPASSFGSDVTATGTLMKDRYGNDYVHFVSPIGNRILTFNLANPVYGIVKACTFNSGVQACDTKTVQLKFT